MRFSSLVSIFAAWTVAAGVAAAVDLDNPSGGAIVRHRLRARIEPTTASLAVTDTLTLRHRKDVSAGRSFPFLLAKELTLLSVEGMGIAVQPREGRLRPRDLWAEPPYDEMEGYARARCVWLEPEDAARTWPESCEVIVRFAGSVYDTLRPPKSAYARGFETTAGLIDPRGAYLSAATFWIPSRPDERFTFRCALETPVGWHAVSQGELLASTTTDAKQINVWDSPQPMEEIYFIAGPYALRRAERDGIDVMTFTYAGTDEATCQRYIDGTERYLRLYGEKIGPYPFAKFALVENFWQTGFGMPSFTLLGDQVIRLPFILDTSYGHEILHNWWGNGVFVDATRGNWCEGLTNYGADYLYQEQMGEAQARDARRGELQKYLDYVSGSEDIPLSRFRERVGFATQAIGYSKSMLVFHQVRRLLGDVAFWGALQDVYRTHLFQRASWDDLFAAFGARAGRDLTGWKEQWIDRTGAPSISLRSHEVTKGPGGYEVVLIVAQEAPQLYDLRVPVRVGWNDPRAESTQVVVLDSPEARAVFHVARPPDWAAVDPDFDVLRRIHPAEIPPALSRTLGADTAVVVVASGLAPELAGAYDALAREWAGGEKVAVFREDALPAGFSPEVPAWYLGLGPLARVRIADLTGARRDAQGWNVAGVPYPAGHGVVLAGGPADQPNRAWALLEGTTPDQIRALGRKAPHYGKYGYLVFEGDKNVAKGSWDIVASPLRASWTAEGN